MKEETASAHSLVPAIAFLLQFAADTARCECGVARTRSLCWEEGNQNGSREQNQVLLVHSRRSQDLLNESIPRCVTLIQIGNENEVVKQRRCHSGLGGGRRTTHERSSREWDILLGSWYGEREGGTEEMKAVLPCGVADRLGKWSVLCGESLSGERVMAPTLLLCGLLHLYVYLYSLLSVFLPSEAIMELYGGVY